MAQITDIDGQIHEVSDNEANRAILLDRIRFYADSEVDNDEKETLMDLASWLSEVSFA